jgi:8-oxo-dGTP pyrophosphatase MutT (NUDIX family)/NAD(P)H-hydrate repair Nnr-like enzyme with NAD(P)H-hydrate epimerase domain
VVRPDLQVLRQRLAALPAAQLGAPPTGRLGATLVLLAERPDGELDVLYTRRQADLSSHPGQISFPGGRVDPGEGVVDAALREAAEEVGLDPATVEVLGRLPAFYIPPSRYWMSAVVARWREPHPLAPSAAEVAEILTVSTEVLRDPARWRAVPLTAAGATWAWQLAPRQLLWGATAVVTGVLLEVLAPGWSGGVRPEDLPETARVRPWEDPAAAGIEPSPTRARPRLRDVGEVQVAVGGGGHAPTADALGAHVAEAVARLVRRPPGPVVVLAGRGGTGAAGRAAAARIDGPVEVLDVEDPAAPDAVLRAGVLVDALVGRGLEGALRGDARALVLGLSATGAPLVAVDLPTGVDPRHGLRGPSASADVTVAVPPLLPAHGAPGALPFVGDLYLSRAGSPLLRVELVDRPGAWAE